MEKVGNEEQTSGRGEVPAVEWVFDKDERAMPQCENQLFPVSTCCSEKL